MKKITSILVALALVVLPFGASAQTASTSVQLMLTQIATLKAQLDALQTAQIAVKDTLSLIRNLRQGMTGDDVKALQAILAADTSIYPQGIISGFYGNLTTQAVMKFQKKHGIDALGIVGPKTLKKLNEEVNKLGLSQEDDDEDDDNDNNRKEKKVCAKIPPGHLIAPGWLKKNGGQRPIVPECQKLPKGIEDKRDGGFNNGTSTPSILIQAGPSVVVGGTINAAAKLMYGNTPTGTMTFKVYAPGDTSCTTVLSPALAAMSVNGNGTYNSLNFTSIATGTYRFIATYSGDNKNYSVSTNCNNSMGSVNVTAVPDTTAPVISGVGTTNLLATSTSIVWTTDEQSTSAIWYGTVNPINLVTASKISSDTLVTAHTGNLGALATSTAYYYVVVSKDNSGNTATSSQSSFTTLAQ